MLSTDTKATKLAITDTKLYTPVVISSTQDNANLPEQLNSGFKIIINWNKYQAKVSLDRQNHYLDFLIDPSFQEVKRPFVLPFQNENDRKVHIGCFLPNVETKYYNFMIDGIFFFDQSVQSDIRTYYNIRNIATGQGDDYSTGCLLDCKSFRRLK